MNNIKFGLKLWSINYNLLDEARKLIKEGIFHYIELMPVPDTKISPFQKIKVPYIIHIASDKYGVNIADKKKQPFNLEALNQSIKWADILGAEYLILHPGFGSKKNALEFLERIDDKPRTFSDLERVRGKRILIENVPKKGMNDEKLLGFSPEQIKGLRGNRFGFCLDLNHAIKAAVSLKKDYKKYIKEFLKIKPQMFHISDGNLDQEKDEHLSLGKGGYDLAWIKNMLIKIGQKRDIYLVFETPKNKDNLKKDIENINYFKNL